MISRENIIMISRENVRNLWSLIIFFRSLKRQQFFIEHMKNFSLTAHYKSIKMIKFIPGITFEFQVLSW